MQLNCLIRYIFGLLFLFSAVYAQNIEEIIQKADDGDAKYQLMLSEKYEFGDGVKSSPDSAFFWMNEAAKAKNPDALYLTGIAYLRGLNVKKNEFKALDFLNQAADMSNLMAINKLVEIYARKYDEFDESKLPRNQKKAIQFAEKAAKIGDSHAALFYAQALMEGKYCKKNDSLAENWIKFAADKKFDFNAQLLVGQWYLEKKLTCKNRLLVAKSYFEKVYKRKSIPIQVSSAALIGLTEVEEHYKRQHNYLLLGNPFLPTNDFLYILKRME